MALARIEAQLSQKRSESSGKPTIETAPRYRRYTPRYPFAADAEIVDLKSGTRVKGVSSDLSVAGCFVCTQESMEIGTRVHLTLKHKNRAVMMVALVRVLKPKIGMGLQALEVDSISNETLLQWVDDLRKSR